MVRSLADRTFQLRYIRVAEVTAAAKGAKFSLEDNIEREPVDRKPMVATDPKKPMLALSQLSNHLALRGLFSAVSKPNFASKYALESSRRDLHNALLCTVLVGSVWRSLSPIVF